MELYSSTIPENKLAATVERLQRPIQKNQSAFCHPIQRTVKTLSAVHSIPNTTECKRRFQQNQACVMIISKKLISAKPVTHRLPSTDRC